MGGGGFGGFRGVGLVWGGWGWFGGGLGLVLVWGGWGWFGFGGWGWFGFGGWGWFRGVGAGLGLGVGAGLGGVGVGAGLGGLGLVWVWGFGAGLGLGVVGPQSWVVSRVHGTFNLSQRKNTYGGCPPLCRDSSLLEGQPGTFTLFRLPAQCCFPGSASSIYYISCE